MSHNDPNKTIFVHMNQVVVDIYIPSSVHNVIIERQSIDRLYKSGANPISKFIISRLPDFQGYWNIVYKVKSMNKL